jgi:hypothetical protein
VIDNAEYLHGNNATKAVKPDIAADGLMLQTTQESSSSFSNGR